MKVAKSNIIYFFLLILLTVSSIVYHNYILMPVFDNYSENDTYSHIANIHDHLEYFDRFNSLGETEFSLVSYFDNVTGVATLYGFVCKAFDECSFHALALYVNLFFLFLMSLVNLRLINKYFYNREVKYLFFINFFLIYLVQLAGKDIIYLFFLYSILLSYIEKRWITVLILVAVCALLVRFQIVILYALLIIMNSKFIALRLRFLLSYLLVSFLGCLAFSGVLGAEADLGAGLSDTIRQLNNRYYVGNLVFNPLRFVQYIYEFIITPFKSIYPDLLYSGIFLFGFFFYFAFNFLSIKKIIDVENNVFSMFSVCLLLMLLVVPIINLRYFVTILPFIVLAMNYKGIYRKEELLRGN